MYTDEEIEAVAAAIQQAMMMKDAGYDITFKQVAKVSLEKAYWIRHKRDVKKGYDRMQKRLNPQLKEKAK